MTRPIIFPLPGNEVMAERIRLTLDADAGQLETRSFPDGETYLRFATDPGDRDVVLVCTLDRPDPKFLRLVFAAAAAADLNARSIGLVAPYLCYMRQDRRFRPGEAITSEAFAMTLSSHFDWLVTADPHLHRYSDLGEIYPIVTGVAQSAPYLSKWIGANVEHPVLLGPDVESEQWVAEVADSIGAPYRVLRKSRRGDRSVEITVPDLRQFANHMPVLVDDIVSSGRTMIETARRVQEQGLNRPAFVAVHALFSDEVHRELIASGAAVVSTNTVVHPSNAIDLSEALARQAGEAIATSRQV